MSELQKAQGQGQDAAAAAEQERRRQERLEIENRPRFRARETAPRYHTRDNGTREIMVDKEEAGGESVATIMEAVNGWLDTAPMFQGRRELPREAGDRIRRYERDRRPATLEDVRDVLLIQHEQRGESAGRPLAEPQVRVFLNDGRIYILGMDGQPLRRCGLCRETHEKLTDRWRMDNGEVVDAHPNCAKRKLRERQRQGSMIALGAV